MIKAINEGGTYNNAKCYALNNKASKHMKQKLIELEREIEKSTITAETINNRPQ